MNFSDFQSKIKGLPVFNLNDVRKLDPDFHQPQLMYWLKKGHIKTFAGEYYSLSDALPDEGYLFMGANKLYEPSYVSLESALAYYQIIPETVLGVTSVSSRKTKHFNSDWGVLSYRTIKPVLMFGYQVIEGRGNVKYSIAKLEKVVLDYLYLNSHIQSREDFEGLRWNKDQLGQLVHNALFEKYLKVFNKQSLVTRVNRLMEYINA